MPDKEKTISLVCAAQAGDDLAFSELVRAYQDIAVAYATSILRDYHLAEDAAQEAFVEAYRELASLREPAAFAAWFRTIIYKHCDRMTRRKRRPLIGLEAALEMPSPDPTPQESLESQETRASVWEAIAALSDTERAVVLLYYMGEHSQAVIAEFLNVTTNAVKTRLYSARKRLRKYMGNIEESLNAARPSSDPKFAEKVQRLIRPEALKQKKPWMWSPGIGADVWEMFCACITGDIESVKRLLDKDPSLARSHYEYRTPLSFAVRENHVEIAKYLLDHGADLHAREEEFCSTPLAWAANFGKIRMVEFLLRRGAKPKLPDDPPWATPLAWATRRGHHEIVQLLTTYEQSGGLSAHSMEEYEALAKDLVEAYGSGDVAAFLRALDLFQIKPPLNWDRHPLPERIARFRRFVRERLGRPSESENESETLALADARLIVARAHGFASWAELAKHIEG